MDSRAPLFSMLPCDFVTFGSVAQIVLDLAKVSRFRTASLCLSVRSHHISEQDIPGSPCTVHIHLWSQTFLQGDLHLPIEGGLWTLRPRSSLCFLLLKQKIRRTTAAHHTLPDPCSVLLVLLPSYSFTLTNQLFMQQPKGCL